MREERGDEEGGSLRIPLSSYCCLLSPQKKLEGPLSEELRVRSTSVSQIAVSRKRDDRKEEKEKKKGAQRKGEEIAQKHKQRDRPPDQSKHLAVSQSVCSSRPLSLITNSSKWMGGGGGGRGKGKERGGDVRQETKRRGPLGTHRGTHTEKQPHKGRLPCCSG